MEQLFFSIYCLATWIIHELRLLQRQGSGPRSCSELPQVGCNEADVVRSTRPKGKSHRWDTHMNMKFSSEHEC